MGARSGGDFASQRSRRIDSVACSNRGREYQGELAHSPALATHAANPELSRRVPIVSRKLAIWFQVGMLGDATPLGTQIPSKIPRVDNAMRTSNTGERVGVSVCGVTRIRPANNCSRS